MPRNPGFFDQWYSEMGRSGRRDAIVRQALGLPPDMDASGLLPWVALTELTVALNLAPGQLLVDLGCGRGEYGLELARQAGACLLGLDFSPVAVAAAASRAASTGIAGRERDLYESAVQADAGGDPAIESLQEEARRGLELFDSTRRVCVTATAPQLTPVTDPAPGKRH